MGRGRKNKIGKLLKKVNIGKNFYAFLIVLVTLLLTSPLLIERYYHPDLVYRESAPQEVEGKGDLYWSGKNIGRQTATNIRVNIFTQNAKTAEVVTSERVPSQITKSEDFVSVDIPRLPKGETIDIEVRIPPPKSLSNKEGSPYLPYIVSVISDNCKVKHESGPFEFYIPDGVKETSSY